MRRGPRRYPQADDATRADPGEFDPNCPERPPYAHSMNAQRAEPRVLHFNDCAFVGRIIVTEAARQGHSWDYLSPEQVRPTATHGNPVVARAQYLPYLVRRARHLRRADVVHVHYATSARLLREPGIPVRPYLLHLHGTDVREQAWTAALRDEIARAVGDAAHVYYTNLDTTEKAERLRPDAEYMPAFVDLQQLDLLGTWSPPQRPRIVFASRWDDVKGAVANIDLAVRLRFALPEVSLVGLDWGPHAHDARRAGVDLVPRVPHEDYLRLLASASLVIGQSRPIISVSEAEAMALGIPVAAVGSRIPRPDDGTTPPMFEGSRDEVVEAVRAALEDPTDAARRLGGAAWARAHHNPGPWVPRLAERYASTAP